MQMVAESWLVFRLTGSSALLGLSAFAGQIPVFLFAPIGGAVADRFNRHRIIVVTQSVSMVLPLILAALTLSGRVRVWHVFVLAMCLGIVNAFDIPARQAFVVDMVGRDDLLNAIALNSSMVNGARILGPSVAGLTVAAVGEGWCFLINGVSYLAVIAGLLMMRVPRTARQPARRSALHDTIEGFRFVARTAPVRALLVLLGIISFAGMPYSVLMPVFAESILHAGPEGLGVRMGASGASSPSALARRARARSGAPSVWSRRQCSPRGCPRCATKRAGSWSRGGSPAATRRRRSRSTGRRHPPDDRLRVPDERSAHRVERPVTARCTVLSRGGAHSRAATCRVSGIPCPYGELRAERAGGASGRVSTINITSTDSAGNSSSSTVFVTVPNNR